MPGCVQGGEFWGCVHSVVAISSTRPSSPGDWGPQPGELWPPPTLPSSSGLILLCPSPRSVLSNILVTYGGVSHLNELK